MTVPSFDDGTTHWDDGVGRWDEIGGTGASVQAASSDAGVALNSDIVARLFKWLPDGWFPRVVGTRILAMLAGMAAPLSSVLAQITYVKLQTRVRSATDGFLDMISYDFFAEGLPRLSFELDDAFRARILANLVRSRVTRQGIVDTLTALTGREPRVFEPKRPMDTGGWGGNPFGGYGVAGGYSNPSIQTMQALVVAYRGNSATDASIYAAVDAAKPIATEIWVAISN